MTKFSGVYTALVTPFKNGEVDLSSLKRIVKFQESAGVSGCVINGTTGECATTTENERRAVFDCVKNEVGGAFHVLVGTGSYSTQKAIDQTKVAQKWGADGAMIVTPYFVKPPQRGLVHHFLEIAKSVDLPIMLYNCPKRTMTSLSIETIEVLSRQKNIVAIKEASGDVTFGREIINRCGSDFSVLSGDDATSLDLLSEGGSGIVSVLSNVIPIKIALLYKYMISADPDEPKQALKDFERYTELIRLLSIESNPIPVKMALKLMGFIDSFELRSPLVNLEEEETELLQQELISLGILN